MVLDSPEPEAAEEARSEEPALDAGRPDIQGQRAPRDPRGVGSAYRSSDQTRIRGAQHRRAPHQALRPQLRLRRAQVRPDRFDRAGVLVLDRRFGPAIISGAGAR